MSPQKQIHNMVLDFLYREICRGKTNQEIFRAMEKASTMLPPMNNEELDAVRERFKERERTHPAKMAEFRSKLGIR